MFETIMVPVDLAHSEKLEKSLKVAADLSKHYGAQAFLIGVTASQPSAVAHTPAEFRDKLAAFAEAQAEKHGVAFKAKAAMSQDPARDLDENLDKVVHEIGADLVIMASHVPSFAEHLIASNAGYLASHTDVSVFVVR